MAKTSTAEVQVPEIRFRPPAALYAKAARVAEGLGITVTEVARMGLAQIASAREIRLEQAQTWRDTPIYGATLGRVADIADAAGRAAAKSHIEAGRLDAAEPKSVER